ncbi:AidA/PixA family protein [Streptomyces sp. NPDC057702]|uniref:AidA/PixA family protein n=1 Tax=unclassified Streptomyces TaxID=2593676 RepID=UPI00367E74DE
MSETIDVLVAINAQDLIANTQNPSQDHNNPTPVSDPKSYIYMTVRHKNEVNGSSGAELNVSAKRQDTIRWRETTYSVDSFYSVLFYRYVPGDPSKKLIETPQSKRPTADLPYPDPQAGDEAAFKTQKDVIAPHWSAEVLNKGSDSYTFFFQVIDQDGKVVGYFSWDPFLTIS